MPWPWRGREPLHEKLAREGGLGPEPGRSLDPIARHAAWGAAGIHGVARPREWDAVMTVDAPELEGSELEFVALPDGTLLAEDALGDLLAPLADALERELRPPYRAEAVNRGGGRWAVAARAIEVVELAGVDGDEISLALEGGQRTLLVDGRPAFGSVPALERVAAARFDAYAARVERLDGDLFELRLSPL